MRHVIVYHSGATWEVDYVLKTLCANIVSKCEILFATTEQMLLLESFQNTNLLLVFSSNLVTFEQLVGIVNKLKPAVCIHLSDEFGTRPEFCKLQHPNLKLICRQHTFAEYPKPLTQTLQMPLGYMTKFPLDWQSWQKLSSERTYVWSFIGALRPQRVEMIDTFRKHFEESEFLCNTSSKVSVTDMTDVYKNSKFVLNGRGCVRLDCFRIYEAIMCGAIPIIVGSQEEVAETFFFNGTKHFFLICDTWEKAVTKVKYLQNNLEEMNELQRVNIQWLKHQFATLQDAISSCF